MSPLCGCTLPPAGAHRTNKGGSRGHRGADWDTGCAPGGGWCAIPSTLFVYWDFSQAAGRAGMRGSGRRAPSQAVERADNRAASGARNEVKWSPRMVRPRAAPEREDSAPRSEAGGAEPATQDALRASRRLPPDQPRPARGVLSPNMTLDQPIAGGIPTGRQPTQAAPRPRAGSAACRRAVQKKGGGRLERGRAFGSSPRHKFPGA